MKNFLLIILCATAGIFLMNFPAVAASLQADKEKEPDIFIKSEISDSEAYEHERFFITNWLYVSEAHIDNIEEVSPQKLKSGEFSYISNVSPLPHRKEVEIKGKKYLVIPIKKFLVTLHETGKYKLEEGKYNVIVSEPIIVDDPFFGRIRTSKRKRMELTVPSLEFKIKGLPNHDKDIDFSGAVGNFEIETIVPPGEIIIGKEATVVFKIKGVGLIGTDVLPEYQKAFGVGNKLKSVSDNNDLYFNGTDVISEKNVICNFIPEDIENCVIGSAEFCFFNPETKKYQTIRTKPVEITVNSSTIQRERIDI